MSYGRGSSSGMKKLSWGMDNLSLDSEGSDGWEVYGGKSQKKQQGSYNNKAKQPLVNAQPNPINAWANGGPRLGLTIDRGRGRGRGRWNGNDNRNLENWSTRTMEFSENEILENVKVDEDIDEEEDKLDLVEDTDEDENMSDGCDSDASIKSHETEKKNKLFKKLFGSLDKLTLDQINDPKRQWHCAACQGGSGQIDWYVGLQALIQHAKTKGSKRVKLHRKLAHLLEEELSLRGTSINNSGEIFGNWKGLDEQEEKQIVWPPMVMIRNTQFEKDYYNKWTGMGSQELLQYFNYGDVKSIKARHSYGPQGHRGVSLLIFEASAVGYLEAERLSKHLEDSGKGRTAWETSYHLLRFTPGGKRQLYGYMAGKRDVEFYNQHAHGRSIMKFQMVSYQEMVVNQLKQMTEDNQQLLLFKREAEKEKKHAKTITEAYDLVSEKFRQTVEDNRIVRKRTKEHHERCREEMNAQEDFFKEKLQIIHEARRAKEDKFEKLQHKKLELMKQTHGNHSNQVERVSQFIQTQDHEMNDFAAERERLIRSHEQRMIKLKRQNWEAEIALEKEMDIELSELMNKYTPNQSDRII